jgi:hypothetical protein
VGTEFQNTMYDIYIDKFQISRDWGVPCSVIVSCSYVLKSLFHMMEMYCLDGRGGKILGLGVKR